MSAATSGFGDLQASDLALIPYAPDPSPTSTISSNTSSGVDASGSGFSLSGLGDLISGLSSTALNVFKGINAPPSALPSSRPPISAASVPSSYPGAVYYPGYGYYANSGGAAPNSSNFLMIAAVALGAILLLRK